MEVLNKKMNNILFIISFLAILPTMFLGIVSDVENYKTIIWVWDVLIIIGSFVYTIFKKRRIQKSNFALMGAFLLIIALQFATYISSLDKKIIQPLYMVLPIVYFIHFLFSYVLLAHTKVKELDYKKFFKMFLYFVIVACIYNIIKNHQYIFSISNITNKYINISSFFSQRNAFGQFIFLGIVSNTYLLLMEKQKRWYVTILFLLTNLLFSFSRTAIFSSIIFMAIVFFLTNSNLKNKNSIWKWFLLVFIIAFGVIIAKNENVIEFLEYYVLRKDDGITGRGTVWKLALSTLSGFRVLFGYGIGTSSSILSIYGLPNSHNTIIELFVTGGLFLFVLYLIFYILIWRSIRKIKNQKLRKIYIAFYISFIIYSLFEKVLIFSTGYAAVFFTIFFVVIPVLAKNNSI